MRTQFRFLVMGIALLCWGAANTSPAADDMPNESRKMTESELIFRSSKLSDLDVYSQTDPSEKVGSLDNLIINSHTGQVLYGVLDAKVGGKDILVPWNVLQLNKSSNESDNKHWLTLNKTKDELASAPRFDKDHWPDFTDSQWKQSVNKFFGLRTAGTSERLEGSGSLTANEMIFLSSKLSDLNVYNRSDTNSKVGNLDNLIINAQSGQVLYGILDTGLGGKDIPVPWIAFQLQKAADKEKYWLTLGKTKDELANAPTFDDDRISDLTDSKWQQTVDNFFGVRTVARPRQ